MVLGEGSAVFATLMRVRRQSIDGPILQGGLSVPFGKLGRLGEQGVAFLHLRKKPKRDTLQPQARRLRQGDLVRARARVGLARHGESLAGIGDHQLFGADVLALQLRNQSRRGRGQARHDS